MRDQICKEKQNLEKWMPGESELSMHNRNAALPLNLWDNTQDFRSSATCFLKRSLFPNEMPGWGCSTSSPLGPKDEKPYGLLSDIHAMPHCQRTFRCWLIPAGPKKAKMPNDPETHFSLKLQAAPSACSTEGPSPVLPGLLCAANWEHLSH